MIWGCRNWTLHSYRVTDSSYGITTWKRCYYSHFWSKMFQEAFALTKIMGIAMQLYHNLSRCQNFFEYFWSKMVKLNRIRYFSHENSLIGIIMYFRSNLSDSYYEISLRNYSVVIFTWPLRHNLSRSVKCVSFDVLVKNDQIKK